MKVSKPSSCTMHFNLLFLVMQLVITVGIRNGFVQGLDIDGYPVPDQCASICTPAAALYDSCTAISCLCTAGSDTEVQQCVNCVIPIEPGLVSALEPLREDFNALCGNLPPLTFPPTATTSVIAPTDTSSSTTETVTSPAATSVPVSATSQTPQIVTTTVDIVPLSTNSGNGAELSVQSQLGSMSIAIGIGLLLRLL